MLDSGGVIIGGREADGARRYVFGCDRVASGRAVVVVVGGVAAAGVVDGVDDDVEVT